MNSHVNDNRTLFYIFCRDHLRLADSHHQNIRSFGYFFQIFGTAVSHRHRTVLPKQQQCHGFADDITSAYHHTLFSGDLNTGTLQQLYDSCRSTGHKARLADAECTDILGMKSVYIL